MKKTYIAFGVVIIILLIAGVVIWKESKHSGKILLRNILLMNVLLFQKKSQ